MQVQESGFDSSARGKRFGVRHRVLAFCASLAALTYLDRVCISVTAQAMTEDLGLSNVQMGLVFSAFTLAYGLFEVPTGAWGDRIGGRRVITRIVVWWSSFTVMTAGAFNFASLVGIRFLFGAGEAGAWPNAARVLSRWFPSTERGMAQGVFFMGAHLAGGLTPILVAALLQIMHWRTVFVVFGLLGFVWSWLWYSRMRDEPREDSSISPQELEYIESGRVTGASHSMAGVPWRKILHNRSVWGLCAMYFTQTYGFYFYITWMPTYLAKERGITGASIGLLAGVPLLFSVVADFFGGATTDYLCRRFGLRIGRVSVGVASFLLASGFLVWGTSVAEPVASTLLIGVAAAWSNFLLGASWGAAVDIGGGHSGVVSAFMNTAGQVGGMLSPVILAFVVDEFASWSAPLYLTGALYFAGALCWLLVDPTKSIESAT